MSRSAITMTPKGQTCGNTPILGTLQFSVTNQARRVAEPGIRASCLGVRLPSRTRPAQAPQALRCGAPGQLVLALDELVPARLSPDSGGGMFMS